MPEVDRAGSVPDEHLRRVGGGHAVVRGVLREACQDRGARPDGVPQVPVNQRISFEARDPYVELALPARVDAEGISDG